MMTNAANLQKAFELAVEQYETLGVNVDRALERLRDETGSAVHLS